MYREAITKTHHIKIITEEIKNILGSLSRGGILSLKTSIMKAINILLSGIILIIIFTSCETEEVLPIQENKIQTVSPEDQPVLIDSLFGEWATDSTYKDSIRLSFDYGVCSYYSVKPDSVFDFEVRFSTSGNTIYFEDCIYLLYNVSKIEFLSGDKFKMINSRVINGEVYYSDIQYYERIK